MTPGAVPRMAPSTHLPLPWLATVYHAVVDRKSTRLNSSHTVISYAVFCLKKKKHHTLLVEHKGTQRPTHPGSQPPPERTQHQKSSHAGTRPSRQTSDPANAHRAGRDATAT